jgi:hypothetical protein
MSGPPKQDTDASIIIVNWNTKGLLESCLKSIFEQTQDIRYEVMVVDNGSSDGSAAMVKGRFPQVILIENAENHGFAAANNQGMAVAQGRYVLLLNSDTIILDNAISKVVHFADSHPEAGVVGCRVLNPDRTVQPTCFMFPSLLNMILSCFYLYKLFPQNRFFGRESMTWWQRDDLREVDVVSGCFMLVRRKAIQEVGMMDDSFFMYGEETDWCWRFKHANWKALFSPIAEIIHYGGQSTKQAAPEMILQLKGSILRFLRKNRSWLEYKLSCFLVWLFFLLRIPALFVKFILNPTDRTDTWVRMVAYAAGTKRLLLSGFWGLCTDGHNLKG